MLTKTHKIILPIIALTLITVYGVATSYRSDSSSTAEAYIVEQGDDPSAIEEKEYNEEFDLVINARDEISAVIFKDIDTCKGLKGPTLAYDTDGQVVTVVDDTTAATRCAANAPNGDYTNPADAALVEALSSYSEREAD